LNAQSDARHADDPSVSRGDNTTTRPEAPPLSEAELLALLLAWNGTDGVAPDDLPDDPTGEYRKTLELVLALRKELEAAFDCDDVRRARKAGTYLVEWATRLWRVVPLPSLFVLFRWTDGNLEESGRVLLEMQSLTDAQHETAVGLLASGSPPQQALEAARLIVPDRATTD